MRTITASAIMSLDGVIESPEKWSMDYWTEESEQLNHDRLFNSEALLLGRHTYESFAAVWPTMTDEQGFAERINSLPTYVVSTTLEKAEWNNATIISDDVVAKIAALKAEPGGRLLIYGIGRLAYTLIDHGLLDELEVALHPVLAGSANPDDLIARNGAVRKLELTESKTLSSGVVNLTFRPKPVDGGAA